MGDLLTLKARVEAARAAWASATEELPADGATQSQPLSSSLFSSSSSAAPALTTSVQMFDGNSVWQGIYVNCGHSDSLVADVCTHALAFWQSDRDSEY